MRFIWVPEDIFNAYCCYSHCHFHCHFFKCSIFIRQSLAINGISAITVQLNRLRLCFGHYYFQHIDLHFNCVLYHSNVQVSQNWNQLKTICFICTEWTGIGGSVPLVLFSLCTYTPTHTYILWFFNSSLLWRLFPLNEILSWENDYNLYSLCILYSIDKGQK